MACPAVKSKGLTDYSPVCGGDRPCRLPGNRCINLQTAGAERAAPGAGSTVKIPFLETRISIILRFHAKCPGSPFRPAAFQPPQSESAPVVRPWRVLRRLVLGVHILPWFAAAGYPAYALSLRGHGKSPGRDDLGSLHLDDYMDDIRQVVADLPARPVLIGHSMGATLVERLVAEETFPGAALICPVPPSGLLPVLTRLWWGRPDFFWHAQKLHRGAIDPVAMSTLREFYFTTNAPPEILAGAMRHLSPESPQAVMELAWRGMPSQPLAHDTPMLRDRGRQRCAVHARGCAGGCGAPWHRSDRPPGIAAHADARTRLGAARGNAARLDQTIGACARSCGAAAPS